MKFKWMVALAFLIGAASHAEIYPNRPITIVVATPAGGALDAIARVMADKMSKSMGQAVLVDNRAGGAGVIAGQMVSHAAPDGYTLLLSHSGALLTTPLLMAKPPYRLLTDFTPITEVTRSLSVFAVSAEIPVKTVSEFVSWAEKNKGKVSFGSIGIGSYNHIIGSHLNRSRSLEMVHAPYKGEAAVGQDLAGGQISWAVSTLVGITPHVQSGRVRLLAVMANNRLTEFPDVPTIVEAGFPDPELRPDVWGWSALVGPPGLPAPIVQRLEKEARAAIYSDEFKSRVLGNALVGTGSAAFTSKIQAAMPTVNRLLKDTGTQVNN